LSLEVVNILVDLKGQILAHFPLLKLAQECSSDDALVGFVQGEQFLDDLMLYQLRKTQIDKRNSKTSGNTFSSSISSKSLRAIITKGNAATNRSMSMTSLQFFSSLTVLGSEGIVLSQLSVSEIMVGRRAKECAALK
jgi:hypothetical protein